MSVILEDARGESLQVNAWNWGVLHFALEHAKPQLLEADTLTLMRSGGATLNERDILFVAAFLERVLLPRIGPGMRMMPDFSVTDAPDDGTFHRDDLAKNYSPHHDVLTSLIAFLAKAQAPLSIL